MVEKTRKDEIFEEAKEKFDTKLDRRLSLEAMEEQLNGLKKTPKVKEAKKDVKKVPKTIRNIKTGNTFGPLPNWESNPNLEVIEWETE